MFSACGGDDDTSSLAPQPEQPDRDASGNLKISAVNFPDENFRTYLLAQDYGQDGVLTGDEISEVITIEVPEKNISNLKGLGFFTALQSFVCNNNQLTSLDVSKNTALMALGCNNNQLTTLDVSKNTALMVLGCSNNQLTSLDVSKNTALSRLGCFNNQLTSLDVSKNTALMVLVCSSNKLTTLDVTQNSALQLLHCDPSVTVTGWPR